MSELSTKTRVNLWLLIGFAIAKGACSKFNSPGIPKIRAVAANLEQRTAEQTKLLIEVIDFAVEKGVISSSFLRENDISELKAALQS